MKTLFVSAPPSGTGVVESLALYHAPLTMMLFFGTTAAGSGLVTLEKSPPFFWGAGWTGAGWDVVPWMIWPQARNDDDRQMTITTAEHLERILFSSNGKTGETCCCLARNSETD